MAHTPGEQVAALHRRASAWFATQGMVDEAIRHALSAGEPRQAALLIEENLHPLIDREEDPSRLEAWIRLLPAELADHDPAALLARAWLARLRDRMADVPVLLRAVEAALDDDTSRDEATREGMRGSVATLWGYAGLVAGDAELMLASTEIAIRRVPGQWSLVRLRAEFLHGWALLLSGREDEARQFFAASRAGAAPTQRSGRAGVLAAEATMHVLNLRTRDAADVAAELLLVASADRQMTSTVMAHLFAGLASYERNDLEGARDHFRAGPAGRFGVSLTWSVESVLGLVLTLHALGEDEEAQDELDRVTMLVNDIGARGPLQWLRSCQAHLALDRGDDDEVGRLVRLLGEDRGSAFPSFIEVPEVTQARWLLRQGTEASLQGIDGIIGQLRQVAAARHSTLGRVRADILHALLLQARGDTRGALAVLGTVVAITRTGEVVRLLVDFGTPMQQLLAEIMRAAPEPDPCIAHILAAFPTPTGPLVAAMPSRREAQTSAVDALTWREVEVLTMLDARMSNKEIARALHISSETVKKHTGNIYQKLQVGSRREAVSRAHGLGLLRDIVP